MKRILIRRLLDLAPAPGNPRSSEGAFFTKPDGEMLFVYSRFKGSDAADNAAADLCLLSSRDGGERFENPRILFTCGEDGAKNIMSVSLLPMENGDIGLFYLVRRTDALMQMVLRRSADGGATWGERVLCTPKEGRFVVNNDRVVRLSDGSILIPAAFHPGTEGIGPEEAALFFRSRDDGRSWEELPGCCRLEGLSASRSGLQEPGVIELSPGRLWGWARTDLGRQYQFFSNDGGESWSQPEPSQFTAPLSPLSMKRGPDGRLYAVWNPVPLYNGRSAFSGSAWTGGRTPLVIAASGDNGRTFGEPAVLEDNPGAGYCYCAMHFTERGLLLGYCAGGEEDGSCLARTRLSLIPAGELSRI